MREYFEHTVDVIQDSLGSIDETVFSRLLVECDATLASGHKIIVSGLGKNVPICDKFVGTMLSLGLNASFMHTNSAILGDLGMVHDGDLVIILTKSGSTAESVHLAKLLIERGSNLWLFSFNEHGALSEIVDKHLGLRLIDEGDEWNIVPNNSTVVFLIVLQSLSMEMARMRGVTLADFKVNHPGGAIGQQLAKS